MTEQTVMSLTYQALKLALMVAGPLLLATLVVGLLISIVQAAKRAVMAALGRQHADPEHHRHRRHQRPPAQRQRPAERLRHRHRQQRGRNRADLQHAQIQHAQGADAVWKIALDERRDDHVANAHAAQRDH